MPGMIDIEYENPVNPLPVSLNRYDRVPDVYGTGAIICWLLTAYTAWTQFVLSDPGADTIKRDLLVTLAYPIVVAGHLILQIRDYPAKRSDIWITNKEEDIELVAVISSSCFVCLMGLGINMVLWLSIKDKVYPGVVAKKRLGVLGLSSLWVFGGLCSVGSGTSLGHWFVGALCIVATALLFAAIPYFFDAALYFIVKFIYILVVSVVYFVDATAEELMVRIVWMLYTLMVSVVWLGVSCLPPFVFYMLLFPRSTHGITDLGQAMAAIGGVINAMYALFAVAKRYGRDRAETFRNDLADFLGEDFVRPTQTRIWGRLPRDW
jgi:hypothetical protein